MAIEWRDEGVLLAVRRHGETHAVATLLTAEHGRHAGLVHGGQSAKKAALLQPGNVVEAAWRARLADSLGSLTLELVEQPAAALYAKPKHLAALLAACALLEVSLPERAPHPTLFERTLALARLLAGPDDPGRLYVLFELALLTDLGFGLDLSTCAVTGAADDLAFVSPRTGRAVSRAGAGVWADRLLLLPPFLIGDVTPDGAAVLDGLRLTGHFLRRHVLDPADRPMPEARQRLAAELARNP